MNGLNTKPGESAAVPSSAELTFYQKIRLFFWRMLPLTLLLMALVYGISRLWVMIEIKRIELKDQRMRASLEHEENKVDVVTCKIRHQVLIDNILLPGILAPWEDLTLQAQISGKVVKILKQEGDPVKKDEPIVLIDDRDYRANLKISETRLERTKKDFTRSKQLYEKRVVSQTQYEEDHADLAEAEAKFELDRLNLERCTIRAPFAGTINRRYVNLGSLVSPGTAIIDLLDTEKVKVDISIPEADIDRVRNLETVKIKVVSLESRVFTGRKIFLSLKPDRNIHSYLLRLEVANPGNLLRPGMFVEADVIREYKEKAILIPLFSVIAKGNSRFCYVVNKGVASRRPVKLGVIKNAAVEITDGLGIGDRLVVKGHRQLDDAQPVNIIQDVDLGNPANFAMFDMDAPTPQTTEPEKGM